MTQDKIKKLYALVHLTLAGKNIDKEDMQDTFRQALDNIYRAVGVWSADRLTSEQVEKAYTLVDHLNDEGELLIDTQTEFNEVKDQNVTGSQIL